MAYCSYRISSWLAMANRDRQQRRADAFAAAAEDVWPVKEVYSMDEALNFFDPPEGPESEDSCSSVPGSVEESLQHPLLLTSERDADDHTPPAVPEPPGVHLSTATALPEIGGLVRELPDIIAKAAAAKNVLVPPAQVSAPPDDMTDGFATPQGVKRDAVWPRFPAIQRYQSGAAAEPGKLRAPVSTYIPITKVDDFTDFPVTLRGGRRPVPPSPKDQLTAHLADRSHQCAFQASAAANNIALLCFHMRDLALQPDPLSASTEQAAEISRAASASSAADVVCIRSSRVHGADRSVADDGAPEPVAEQLQPPRGAQEGATRGSHQPGRAVWASFPGEGLVKGRD
ncbi:hypothetical protein L3Q82_019586 [Scortum barcoo]|uniref:Uncharacterized protein n=1 Tax=Scortum barcoo TaxID=214431 RepID=A0ACB8VBZ8_9TELE|nr:hypothetical protein L3Q82_019586 [Scortum barcoo]